MYAPDCEEKLNTSHKDSVGGRNTPHEMQFEYPQCVYSLCPYLPEYNVAQLKYKINKKLKLETNIGINTVDELAQCIK